MRGAENQGTRGRSLGRSFEVEHRFDVDRAAWKGLEIAPPRVPQGLAAGIGRGIGEGDPLENRVGIGDVRGQELGCSVLDRDAEPVAVSVGKHGCFRRAGIAPVVELKDRVRQGGRQNVNLEGILGADITHILNGVIVVIGADCFDIGFDLVGELLVGQLVGAGGEISGIVKGHAGGDALLIALVLEACVERNPAVTDIVDAGAPVVAIGNARLHPDVVKPDAAHLAAERPRSGRDVTAAEDIGRGLVGLGAYPAGSTAVLSLWSQVVDGDLSLNEAGGNVGGPQERDYERCLVAGVAGPGDQSPLRPFEGAVVRFEFDVVVDVFVDLYWGVAELLSQVRDVGGELNFLAIVAPVSIGIVAAGRLRRCFRRGQESVAEEGVNVVSGNQVLGDVLGNLVAFRLGYRGDRIILPEGRDRQAVGGHLPFDDLVVEFAQNCLGLCQCLFLSGRVAACAQFLQCGCDPVEAFFHFGLESIPRLDLVGQVEIEELLPDLTEAVARFFAYRGQFVDLGGDERPPLGPQRKRRDCSLERGLFRFRLSEKCGGLVQMPAQALGSRVVRSS
ncbi:MAG: hypothetical protein WC156_14420 [Pedobacter sp.]